MFDTINNPPTNEHDARIEELKNERLKIISENLKVYTDMCLQPIREDGRKLLPAEGTFTIHIGGETITFSRY